MSCGFINYSVLKALMKIQIKNKPNPNQKRKASSQPPLNILQLRAIIDINNPINFHLKWLLLPGIVAGRGFTSLRSLLIDGVADACPCLLLIIRVGSCRVFPVGSPPAPWLVSWKRQFDFMQIINKNCRHANVEPLEDWLPPSHDFATVLPPFSLQISTRRGHRNPSPR